MTRNKKIKTVSNNENSNKTVAQKTKRSNSKAKRLNDVSNCLNIRKEKDASENKSKSRKSKKINKTDTLSMSSSNTKMESVVYEEKQVTSELIEGNSSNLPDKDDNGTAKQEISLKGPGRRKSSRLIKHRKIESVEHEEEQGTAEKIEENSSNLPDKDGNETAKLEKEQLNMNCLVELKDYYIMESPNIIKTVETKTTTEYSSNLPDTNEGIPVVSASLEDSGYRKLESFKETTKMESAGYEEEHGTSETIPENSSTLPETDDNEESVHKKLKTKIVTFNKIRRIKKFSSKRRLKDKLNSNIMKEKDASENKSEYESDTLSMSSSNTNMESDEYEEEQDTAEIIEENSSNLPDQDDNETSYFRDLGRRKSRRFFKSTKMESDGYKEEQGTSETILENSSSLLDTDHIEIILTESAKLKIVQNMNISESLVKLEDAIMKSENTKIKTEAPEMEQCTETTTEYSSILPDTNYNETILTESVKLEMECSSNSNSKLKRKLSKVEVIVEVLQDYLKRFKSS